MKMTNFINALTKHLPNAKLASGNRELTCRCVHCGDSTKDKNKRSMYISMPTDEYDVILYNCYRASCDAKGLVTEQTLLDWGIYDKDALLEISRYNDIALKNVKNKMYKKSNTKFLNLNTNYISNRSSNDIKIKYINDRLGTNFDINDIKKFKIILNLYDILNANNIGKLTRHKKVTDLLDRDYVGFMGMDNGLINFRNIYNNKNMRYVNYNLIENSTPNRFYIMPTNVDIGETVNVFLAEGVFDILSVYENLNKKEVPNSMFVGAFGSSYYTTMRWLILDSGMRHIVFHVYLDSDVSNNIVMKLKELAEVSENALYIHTNIYEGEKDFGVPKDRIRDNCKQIVKVEVN